jgi:hypothetical protein
MVVKEAYCLELIDLQVKLRLDEYVTSTGGLVEIRRRNKHSVLFFNKFQWLLVLLDFFSDSLSSLFVELLCALCL